MLPCSADSAVIQRHRHGTESTCLLPSKTDVSAMKCTCLNLEAHAGMLTDGKRSGCPDAVRLTLQGLRDVNEQNDKLEYLTRAAHKDVHH